MGGTQYNNTTMDQFEISINGSSTDSSPQMASTILICIFSGLASFLTVAGNLMVIVSFIINRDLRTVNNYLLLSLAGADLWIGLISMNLFTFYIVSGGWTLGTVLCDLWLAMDYVASNASVMNLFIICLARFLSVTYPVKYRNLRTPKKFIFAIAFAWVTSFLLWAPWILFWPFMVKEGRTVPQNQCYIQFIKDSKTMAIGTACIAFYLPAATMVSLYSKVMLVIRRRTKTLLSMREIKAPNKSSGTLPTSEDEKPSTSSEIGLESVKPVPSPNLPLYRRISNMLLWVKELLCCGASCRRKIFSRSYNVTSKNNSNEKQKEAVTIEKIDNNDNHVNAVDDTKLTSRSSKAGKKEILFSNRTESIKEVAGFAINAADTKRSSKDKFSNDIQLKTLNQSCKERVEDVLSSASKQVAAKNEKTPTSPEDVEEINRDLESKYSKETNVKIRQGKANIENCMTRKLDQRRKLPRRKKIPGRKLPSLPSDVSCIKPLLKHRPHRNSTDNPNFKNSKESPSPVLSNKSPVEEIPPNLPVTVLEQSSQARNIIRDNPVALQSLATPATYQQGKSHSFLPISVVESSALMDKKSILTNKDAVCKRNPTPGSTPDMKRSRLWRKMMKEVPKKTQEHQRNVLKKKAHLDKETKAARLLTSILATFIILWLPYNIMALREAFCSEHGTCIPDLAWNIGYWLCYLNSTINPLCYALCNQNFRDTFKFIMSMKWLHPENRRFRAPAAR
ncbi:unnamed protein product [Clavelina lepadiformis]|uniref:G-protein coupled receptors family 1 profile domain-containing protein n=1 Tax=Clavelina lepadiformis TaxID=159417 RepID=A0ABP0GM20_CLALP